MKLSYTQIIEIANGAVRATEDGEGIRLYRFTEEQEKLYKEHNADFYRKTFSTAGIKLCFKTDSKTLKLSVLTEKSSSRKYFSFDVFVDGNPIGYLDNYTGTVLPDNYIIAELPLGEFFKSFSLGDGEKSVTVYCPWSVSVSLKEVSVDDGAYVKGVKPEKKLLAFGDSITHGYDALHPSNRYASKLAEALDAEEFNKAIGGEIFFPALAETKEAFCPDYITVAYGTNDWNSQEEEAFKVKCKAFYTSLSKNYPTAKIFALAPIWRKNFRDVKKFGAFENIEKDIKEAVRDLKNVTAISCFDFVPKEEKYFADFRLHPNDKGFEHYFSNLSREIKAKI